jgi:hypothetical protein
MVEQWKQGAQRDPAQLVVGGCCGSRGECGADRRLTSWSRQVRGDTGQGPRAGAAVVDRVGRGLNRGKVLAGHRPSKGRQRDGSQIPVGDSADRLDGLVEESSPQEFRDPCEQVCAERLIVDRDGCGDEVLQLRRCAPGCELHHRPGQVQQHRVDLFGGCGGGLDRRVPVGLRQVR